MKKILLILLITAFNVLAAEFPIGLKEFMTSHMKLLEAQDVEGAIKNLHSKGKNRQKSITDLKAQLPQMAFHYESSDERYIGSDGDLYYVRYKQKTIFDEKWKQMSGSNGIVMDVITIFGKEDGNWKIYDTYMFSQEKIQE